MTTSISLKKASNYLIYLPFLFFIFIVYRRFGDMFLLISSSIFAILLCGLFLARILKASIPAVIVYLLVLFNVINFIVGLAIFEFYVFPLIVPFIPLIALHYANVVGKKLPGIFAFVIMFAGFLLSIIYQTVSHGGETPYSTMGDFQFFRAFAIFFSIYMLLAFRTISLWKMIVLLSFSVLPEILFVYISYAASHQWGRVFIERFGSSVNVPANQIAIWLDVAFPLTLFIALYDKRPRIKQIFFGLAVIYGATMLMTASRGSMAGLPLIPFFIAVKTKSVFVKFLVVVISLAALGVFGRTAIERTFFPERPDVISNIGRKELLKAGRNVLKANHYFFGIGMDNYKTEKYNFNFMKAYDTKSGMSTHNVYLEIWLGWGLIGLLGWLAFFFQGFLRIARAHVHPDQSYLKPAMLLAMILTLIHALFDSPVACFPYLFFLLTFMACVFSLGESEEMRQPSINTRVPSDILILPRSSGP
jgi:O-antigen ligase